jgi:hypothetical protein
MNLGLYSGELHVALPKMEGRPRIHWNGAVIDRETFRLALAFLKWTHDEHKVEGQARFFYNEETGEWKTVVLPQYIWSAGHTREVEADNPVKEKIIEDLLLDGFGEAGTIHHHSNMGAFQSAGDKEDELSRNGFHVTVGTMSAKVSAFHARATFKKIQYEKTQHAPSSGRLNIDQWLPGMMGNANAPHQPIQDDIAKHWLSLEDLPEFPDEWRLHMVERPVEKSNPNMGFRSQLNPTNHDWSRSRTVPGETPSERAQRLHVGHVPVYELGRLKIWLAGNQIAYSKYRIAPKGKAKQLEAPLMEAPKADATSTQLPTIQELRDMRTMKPDEFEIYVKLLREEKRVDTSSDSATVKRKFARSLAKFRDMYVSEELQKSDLDTLFLDLQSMSSRVLRVIMSLADSYGGHRGGALSALPDSTEMRTLAVHWMGTLTDTLNTMHPEEWDALNAALHSTKTVSEYDFYTMMCAGIRSGVDAGDIEDVYDPDGEVNYMYQNHNQD